MATYQIGAFTESELLAQGTAGSNIGKGDSFVMPTSTSVTMDIYDNDSYLSGDNWNNENANDQSGQTATITENGVVTSSGHQIYAECYFWVKDQAGNWYIMIEIEVENQSGDYFSFYGDVPPAGSDLTIYCARNVKCNWVNYCNLQDPDNNIPPLADDDALTIDEDETGTLNVLDNDMDTDGTITVSAVEGGTLGVPFVVESPEGYDAMVTLNADGSLTVVPGPEFEVMGDGESTTVTFTYTIIDNDGLEDTATVTVTVNGVGGDVAIDDAYTVSESEDFGDVDGNVTDNDIDGNNDGQIEIVEANGNPNWVGAVIQGSNGGLATINPDGSFDFSANGEFEALNDGESAVTHFTYAVQSGGGSTADALIIPFTGPNNLEAQVTVIEVDGNLVFTVEVFTNGGDIGDIRGLFFDVSDESLLNGLTASGYDVTDQRFEANNVVNLGNGANVNGDVVLNLGAFDAGTELGTQGIGRDDIRATTFQISHSSQDLTLDFLMSQDFALRLTSVGDENGNRCDSLKLASQAGTATEEVSTATVTVTVNGENEISIDAIDDAITVWEDEGAGDNDGNVLTNDLENDVAYAGDVFEVNADAANVGQVVMGSNGGQITINADGTFDFDANGDFDALNTGDTATTTFTYEIQTGGGTTQTTTTTDFEVFGPGVVITNQIAGVTVSSSDPNKPPMIFDTANPTGGDWDLASSTRGKVMIISEDGDSSDPDDNAGVGSLYFDFDTPSQLTSLTFLDTEESGFLRFYDDQGALIQTLSIPTTADGEEATLNFDVSGVSRLEVNLCGSGAIDDLVFTQTTTEPPITDTATVTVTVQGMTDYVAVADTMTVLASEGAGDADLLDSGDDSVLDNDLEDGGIYGGNVLAVNGDGANIGQMVVGTNGGLLTINADGTVDFDANGEFGQLLDGQTAQTQFNYTIEDGQTASVTVTILGETVRAAFDDVMTVMESETFGDADLLDSGDDSVLDNDTENGGMYSGVVGAVNGSLANVNSFVTGSNGGLLKIMADGTLDFDANDAFDSLAVGESAQTTFTYELTSGEMATVTVNVLGEEVHVANDDVLTVMESETSGDTEVMDNGDLTILDNDTSDGGAYGGVVEQVGGVAGDVGQVVIGSNGGLATIYADGTIDFDANDEFDFLNQGETAQTTFTYGIAGGDTATVTVNIEGENATTGPGPTINLALMLNSVITMYEQADTAIFGLPGYADWNGNGVTNEVIDMAYLMLEDFMTDAYTLAANAGYTLNVSLVSFDGAAVGEGGQFYTVPDQASFGSLLDTKVANDNSGDYGAGFDNANAWFDTVANVGDTNAVFVIGNGFGTDPYVTEHANLLTDHNVIMDSFLPDVVFSGTAYNGMGQIDKDGVTELVYHNDVPNEGLYGSPAGVNALTLDHLLI